MNETFTVEFDGGSRGNPGPAGIGVVVRAADGTPVVTLGRCIGNATNNVAEYTALITGLEEAKKLSAKKIVIRGDSKLVIMQLRGEWKVKNADLRDLYEQARHLLHQFNEARIEHDLRHKNELADRLYNMAMDRRCEVTELPDERPAEIDLPSPQATKPGDVIACGRCGCVVEVKKPSSIRPHQLKPFVCQCGNQMG